ncbi:unnamed protein product [Urochloa humidicola]
MKLAPGDDSRVFLDDSTMPCIAGVAKPKLKLEGAAPNTGAVVCPNGEIDDAPNAGAAVCPNGEIGDAPDAGVVDATKPDAPAVAPNNDAVGVQNKLREDGGAKQAPGGRRRWRRRPGELHGGRALLRVSGDAGERERAARLLVLAAIRHAGAQLAKLCQQRRAPRVAGEPRGRRRLRPPVEDPSRLRVLAALRRGTRRRDVLRRLHAEPRHLHGWQKERSSGLGSWG